MKVRCATLTTVVSRIDITAAITHTPAIRKSARVESVGIGPFRVG